MHNNATISCANVCQRLPETITIVAELKHEAVQTMTLHELVSCFKVTEVTLMSRHREAKNAQPPKKLIRRVHQECCRWADWHLADGTQAQRYVSDSDESSPLSAPSLSMGIAKPPEHKFG